MGEEGLGDFVGKGDALLQQLGLHFPHVHGVVAEPHRMRVEAQLVLLLVDRNELVLHHTDCQQRSINLVIIGLDELHCLTGPVLALGHRYVQAIQLHVFQSKGFWQLLLGNTVA